MTETVGIRPSRIGAAGDAGADQYAAGSFRCGGGNAAVAGLIPAEVSGYLCSILALALVLGPVAQNWPLFGSALRVCCGLWLALLAWRHWTAAVHGVEARSVPFSRVFVTTLLNPKGPDLRLRHHPLSGGRKSAAALPIWRG